MQHLTNFVSISAAILVVALGSACAVDDSSSAVDPVAAGTAEVTGDPDAGLRSVRDALEHNLAVLEEGWNTYDVEKIIGLTTREVSFISPYGDRVDGQPALRALVTASFVPGVTHSFELANLRLIKPTVALADEVVIVTGYTLPDGTPLPPVVIHAVTAWVKSGARWLASDIRNHVYLPR